MFNPYLSFSFGYIKMLRDKGYRYLVAQTFECDEAQKSGKTGLLLTPYNDEGLALIHRKARMKDPLACIIDLEKEAHQKKVEDIINPLSTYSVWAGIVKSKEEVEKRLHLRYKLNVRRYIQNNTAWRIRGDSTFWVKMEIVFGEVYLHLKYNQHEAIKERLEVIAKC